MATSIMPKRSSRLNTCDLSTKAVSGKTLRSRKIITVNEESLRTEVATRKKKLYVVIKDVSSKKYRSGKSSNNGSSDKLRKKRKIEKSTKEEKQEEKKTHKRKNIVISSSINKSKHKISVKEKKVTNRPIGRQMSLQESFKQQSMKYLRPRQKKINYCDDSKLLQQHLPLQHQDSIVILEKLDSNDIKKIPVYKTIKTSEQSLENKNDVYDFKYDTNDRKEKPAKKKKKKNIKTKSRVIKKSIRKKVTVETKLVDNRTGKSSDKNVEIVRCKSPLEPAVASLSPPESIEENPLDIMKTSKVDTDVQIIRQTSLSDKPSIEQIKKTDAKKPRIISVENATNITITKALPGNAKDILPFRTSSNIFSKGSMVQYRKSQNSSLLIKSLSPISKEYDTFDPGSPWRPPQLPYVFSYAKHFVQSTPNENKTDIMHTKRIMQIRDNSHNTDKAVNNLSNMVSKNTNSSLLNLSDNKVNYKKNSNICRKFGTEITNTEYLNNCTTIQGNNMETVSEKPVAETEINSVTNIQLDKIASLTSNSHSLDDADDKENVAMNYQTPKKSPRKKLKKRHLSNLSPFKSHEIKNIAQSENVEPQPGPSGIRTLKNLDEQKILRQSNLNNFLNLMDVPENTKITTKHGIFDDTHSSLISSSAIKKSTKPTIGELENAFGFCENVTEFDTSPIKSEAATNPASTKTQTTCSSKPVATQAPSRLSLGELRNNLLLKKPDKSAGSLQATKQQKVAVSKPKEKKNPEEKKNNQLVDAINFSDTFDVLSESERLSNCEPNVPLFVDLEPSHFSKPPQHSYKRKRAVVFNFSDSSSNDENEEVKTHTKKKKLTRMEKENKRRLDEWVKTVNSTFEEIDEYTLLIE